MVYCCVPFCKSEKGKATGISFHEFPVDETLRNKWLKAVSRKDFVPNWLSNSSVVCSKHFLQTDYKPNIKIRVLKLGTVPSVFPGYPQYKSEGIKAPRRKIVKHVPLVKRRKKKLDESFISKEDHNSDMVSCCVPFCKSHKGKTTGISFHEFPVDETLRNKWLKAVSRKDFVPNWLSNSSVVCSKHFLQTDYKPNIKYRVLKFGTVPSVFPGYPQYKSEGIKAPRRKIVKHVPLVKRRKKKLDESFISKEDHNSDASSISSQKMKARTKQKLEFGESYSFPTHEPAPEFVNCSIKIEPEDTPYEETVVVKSEPMEEEMNVNVLDTVGASILRQYLQTDTERSKFEQEENALMVASDESAEFGAIAFKESKQVLEILPEEVKKTKVKFEKEGPALEGERFSLENQGIENGKNQGHEEYSFLPEAHSVSNKRLNVVKSPQSKLPLFSSTAPIVLDIYSEVNLQSILTVGDPTVPSTSESALSFNDRSEMFNCKSKHVVQIEKCVGEKLHTCETCNKSFKHKKDFNRHLRVHTGEKPFVCSTCHKAFRLRGTLKRHSRIHTGEKPFVCVTCNKAFTWKLTLDEHLMIHTGEKPYVCSICSKTFPQKGTLNRHSKIHTVDRPFVCLTCNKGFTKKSILKIHTRIHTGEKPYVCTTCKKSFKQVGDLKIHSRSHTGERPHICLTCNRGFTSKGVLVRHSRIHDGKNTNMCV